MIAGEGRHELGGWADEPPYRTDERGVLAALLGRCRTEGWEIVAARRWKDVPKFRSGDHRRADQRTVLGLVALATRAGCDLLVLVRDADNMLDRPEELEATLAEIVDVGVVGGCAVRTLDAWCLALIGERGTEALRKPKVRLEDMGCQTTADRVALVDDADLARLPDDAYSLRQWLERARVGLDEGSGPAT